MPELLFFVVFFKLAWKLEISVEKKKKGHWTNATGHQNARRISAGCFRFGLFLQV